MWVAACSWKMEAEADKTCFLGDSKDELEVFNSKEELEVFDIKEKLDADDKSRSLCEELELCDSEQVVEVSDLKEADISCFLCDSKEDLELCTKCSLVVTCSHHGNLHR